MPPRKRAESNVTPLRPPSRKGIPQTPAQKAALTAGRAKRDAKRAQPKVREKSRWHQLLDGDITVQDLDDEELKRMQLRDNRDGFEGRPPDWSKHRKLFQSMKQESIRRGQGLIDAAVGDAVKLLVDVVKSRDVQVKDRIKAAELLMARGMGSVPTHVVNHEGTKWDDMMNDDDDPVVIVFEEGTA